MDCMEYMKTLPDNAFDLAVVDPPYGAGFKEGGGCKGWFTKYRQDDRSQSINVERERGRATWNRFGERFDRYKIHQESVVAREEQVPLGQHNGKKIIAWDVAPKEEYFEELFRISRNQIIWGGNYFDLPPTRCFLIWRKISIPTEGFSMSPVEYAWTSFTRNASVFEYGSKGKKDDQRFHPTQKPVELYRWIYKNYAKHGDKILDTHLGSGSSRIAAWDAGLDFVGTEIDEQYFKMEEERFAKHIAQGRLFDNPLPSAEQTSLF